MGGEVVKRVLESSPRAKGAGKLPPTTRANTATTQTPAARFTIKLGIRDWIRQTILAWQQPAITWEAVREIVRKKYPKAEWKRQTLAKYPALQKAFQDTKRRLAREKEEREQQARAKAGKPAKTYRPKLDSDEFIRERINFLEGRVRELEDENDRLKQLFVRWQRNAFAAGITLQQLDSPLLPIDRGQANE
jgi:hypothetical protein